MGNLFTKFSASKEDPIRVCMLGLDAAGKTTILQRLKVGNYLRTLPTIGFNVETVTPCKGLTLTIWDIGGQDKIRQLWKHYYTSTEGLIYVVDSADSSRFGEAANELNTILSEEDMDKGHRQPASMKDTQYAVEGGGKGFAYVPHKIYLHQSRDSISYDSCIPLVVVANKQDLPGAISLREMEGVLQLQDLPQDQCWHVQECCAIKGTGIKEAMNVLAKFIKKQKRDVPTSPGPHQPQQRTKSASTFGT